MSDITVGPMVTLTGAEVDAINVAPGMVTVNGVVLRVIRMGHVVIETPCTGDRYAPDQKVEVFGFVDRATLSTLQGDPLEELGKAYEEAVAKEAEEVRLAMSPDDIDEVDFADICGTCGGLMVRHHPRCRVLLEAELEEYGEAANLNFQGIATEPQQGHHPDCRDLECPGDCNHYSLVEEGDQPFRSGPTPCPGCGSDEHHGPGPWCVDEDGAPCCRAVVTSGDPSQHEPGCHNDNGPEWRGDPRYES